MVYLKLVCNQNTDFHSTLKWNCGKGSLVWEDISNGMGRSLMHTQSMHKGKLLAIHHVELHLSCIIPELHC